MKKISIALIITLLVTSFATAEENFFSCSLGLSSGIPIYGSSSLSDDADKISTDSRIIAGAFLNLNLNPINQITFFGGAEVLSDLNWNNDSYKHFSHIGFPLGIKIYPGLGGLCFGIAYELGFRGEFLKDKEGKTSNEISSWGNGFKTVLEYNFSHIGKSNHYPTIGTSWNLMPRGHNAYDNIFQFYIAANL